MSYKVLGITTKSESAGALMDADSIIYELYIFRGHVYRVTGNGIETADENDKAWTTARADS